MQNEMTNKVRKIVRGTGILGVFIVFCISMFSVASNASSVSNDIYFTSDSLKSVLQKNPEDVETLRQLGLLSLNMANDELAKDCGAKLMAISKKDRNDNKALTYGNLILGQVAILKSEPTIAYKYLSEARKYAEIRSDSASLSSIFNGLAIYTYSYVGDIPEAIHYYHKGLSAAKASGNKKLYYTLMNNIANAHLELNDTLGLKYARQSYEYSKETNNYWLRYTSALCLADTYLFLKDYTRSLRYISEAESLLPYLHNYSPSILYDMRARVQTAIGSYEKASQNFQRAKDLSLHTPERYLNYLNNEAESKMAKGDMAAAKILLDSVLNISSDTTNTHARINALGLKSILNEKLGDLNGALHYQRAYNELKNATNKTNTMRMMSEAHVKWGLDNLSNQLAQQKIATLKHQRNFNIAIIGIIAMIICITILYYYHFKLKHLHKGIVNQMKMAVNREETMKLQIEELKQVKETPSKPAEISPNVKSSQSIIKDIEQFLTNEKAYKDPHITRDSLAEAIGTNSSYVTRAISECYKMNFKQYINNYRIHEAIKILSDPDDDTPLKAIGTEIGFNSTTSFYNHFKEATGMTPAAYREAAVSEKN